MNQPVATPVKTSESPMLERKEKSVESESFSREDGLDISQYLDTYGSPFVADYFGLRDLYQTNTDVRSSVRRLNKHLLEATGENSPVFISKDLLDGLLSELNLNENDSGIYKIKKVLDLIITKSKFKRLKQLQKKALEDIQNSV